MFFVDFMTDNYHSLVLNLCAFGYIRWSHSLAKLVVIVLHHGNSSLFGRLVVILCTKAVFVVWVLASVLTQLYELHQTIGSKERAIRSQVVKYKQLAQIRQELSTTKASGELILIIDSKLSFLQSQFRKHVRDADVTKYLHFRSQVLFIIKSMLSVVVFLTISRCVICYLLLELLLSGGFLYCSYLLNKSAVLVVIFQVLTNTWYVCLLLMVCLTTRNQMLDLTRNALLFNLIVIKYYVCFFAQYVVQRRYEKSLVLPKSETDPSVTEQAGV